MKITCSSCGSKYTIADAKVQGKKVKVRCKSCKESILVDGTDVSALGSDDGEADDAGEDMDSPAVGGGSAKGKDVWSVNLTDDDSREMTLDELIGAWKSGVVTSDAYVWKDGMSDWKPILEVGELKMKLGPAPARGVVSSAGKAMPKAKANDLFGALEAGPAPGAGQKPAEPKNPTGARNDSSVLFSLDSLNSPTGSAAASNVSANIFGDLAMAPATLTTETDLLMAPPKAPPAAPVGARAVSMPAAPAKKGGKGLLIGAVVGGLLLAGGAVFALSGGSKETADAGAQATQVAQDAEQAKAELERAKKMQEEAEKMKADLERAKKEAEEAEKKKAEEAAAAAASDPKAGEQKPADEKAKAGQEEEKPSGGSTKPSPSPSPAPSGGGAFSVEAAKGALSSAAAQAASCAKPGGPTGSGKVQVTFSTSGRVTSANVVSGPFGGTSVGGCVASTFRRARVPAFSGGPKTVSKSFSIR